VAEAATVPFLAGLSGTGINTQDKFQESMSGTRADRPQLTAALEFAREGDVLVVERLDCLARSMRQLLSTVDTLTACGIGLRSLHENIDTVSATGR
jgi:DNA invertase Pin-like site-specific DNA recombinase